MLFLFLLALNTGVQELNECELSIPTEIGEWSALEEDAIYDRSTLYDYMNGGAEVYLSFDYRKVCVRHYTGPNDGEIALDVYDMGTSAEAFGVFSVSIEDPEVGLGQGSEFGAGLLKFWKGKYFVSVVNMGMDESADSMLLEIGKAVDEAIESTGPYPELAALLPRSGLNERSISFFHSNVILNNRFFVASENVLKLSNETNCVFGEYGDMGQEGLLLIIHYPSQQQAEEAQIEFRSVFIPEATGPGPVQTENGNWTAIEKHNDTLSIVFEAPTSDRALQLLSQISLP